jgi:hypothetical protein
MRHKCPAENARIKSEFGNSNIESFFVCFAPLRESLRFGCGFAALGFCGEYALIGNTAAP